MSREPTEDFDLDSLLHPAHAFDHPADVVRDPDLTLSEKRAILAAWASDACAVDSAPSLRQRPRGQPVHFDEVVDALKQLDKAAKDLGETLRPLRSRFRSSAARASQHQQGRLQ